MDDRLHPLGIRHHGPGSAASLVAALDALDPEEVLVEGPPEGSALLRFAAAGLRPPVALLVHVADDPSIATFVPFAVFSPEWQAIRWALRRGRAVSLVDLPAANHLAARGEPLDDAPDDEAVRDPLSGLAALAGYDDGEAWWSSLVEEGGASVALFAEVEAAMTALRATTPTRPDAEREARREAAMRLGARAALARTSGPVVQVVGAWHVPALREDVLEKADKALLKGLPAAKVVATWVPWSDTRLAAGSGYAAGVRSPGWYRALWDSWQRDGGPTAPRALATRWQVRVAHALRRHGLPAPPSSVIDAVRLTEALSALRDRAVPGLAELQDASLATLCHGEEVPWRLVAGELLVGHEVGEVPPEVPQMPLAADLARWQKKLRLAPSADKRELSLDLRSDAGLAKSTLLHRLALIEVPWGVLADAGGSRGTFREKWVIAWEPELSVRLAEALRWGTTIEAAALGRVAHVLDGEAELDALAELVGQALLAGLEAAALHGVARLQAAATAAADVGGLCRAVPPLVDVLRYGTARDLPTAALAELIGGLAGKVFVGLHHGARHLDADAAAALLGAMQAFDRAIHVHDDGARVDGWLDALAGVVDDDEAAPRLRGFAARRLHDHGARDDTRVAASLSASLSPGVPLADSAAWLEGFLGDAAQLLLHSEALLAVVDGWLLGLDEEALLEALPLLRRATAGFGGHERARLLAMVQGRGPRAVAAEVPTELGAFHAGEALLDVILGLGDA